MTVGAFEAKTHFSELLERASKGEPITITRRGVATARLVPVEEPVDLSARRSAAIARGKALRAEFRLGDATVREAVDWGRK
jgi:prevent-host-death family protein